MRFLKSLLVCLFLVTTVYGTAQKKYTEESVTDALKESFVVFVENIRPAYTKGQNFAQFKRAVLVGTSKPPSYTLPPIPSAGENLLQEAYRVLAANYSRKQTLNSASYKVLGKALLYVNDQSRNRSVAEAEASLFGGDQNLLNNNPTLGASRGECKWWQLWCHLNQIFGNGAGAQILQAIVNIIIIIL